MARIRILTSVAGALRSYRRGEVVDMADEVAGSWVASGMAAPAGDGGGSPVAETTARQSGKTGRRKPARKPEDDSGESAGGG